MKRLIVALLSAVVLMAVPAHAVPDTWPGPFEVPKVVKKSTNKLDCDRTRRLRIFGPENYGRSCQTKDQSFAVTRYRKPAQARAFWDEWVSDGYYVRRGHLFVLPGGSVDNPTPYTLEWAQYAQSVLGGRIIHTSN